MYGEEKAYSIFLERLIHARILVKLIMIENNFHRFKFNLLECGKPNTLSNNADFLFYSSYVSEIELHFLPELNVMKTLIKIAKIIVSNLLLLTVRL
jgi:hypothetical protein